MPRRVRPPTPLSPAAGSTSVELIVLLPVLFALMFTGVQAALVHHARTVASAAAVEGARAAGAEYGTAADGQAAAEGFLAQAGQNALTASSASATRTTTTAEVVVVATSLSCIPWWEPEVRQSARVQAERTTAP
jgi:Flp pilus assembly protein TadG